MTERLGAVYRRHPNIVTRLIAGELILVPIHQTVGEMGSIYTLNESGARIWELLDGAHTLAQVRDLLVGEFEVDASQAEADLLELVDSLLGQGVLIAQGEVL